MKYIERNAYHEAGHAVACIILNRKFKWVSVNSEKINDGSIKLSSSYKESKNQGPHNYYNPRDFSVFFKHDFIAYAGLISAAIKKDKSRLKITFRDLADGFYDITSCTYWSLRNKQETTDSKHHLFMLEYTYTVLSLPRNWLNIESVAIALIEKKQLSYEEVKNIISK